MQCSCILRYYYMYSVYRYHYVFSLWPNKYDDDDDAWHSGRTVHGLWPVNFPCPASSPPHDCVTCGCGSHLCFIVSTSRTNSELTTNDMDGWPHLFHKLPLSSQFTSYGTFLVWGLIGLTSKRQNDIVTYNYKCLLAFQYKPVQNRQTKCNAQHL